MNLAAVMDALASAVESAGVTDRVFPYPPAAVAPPCAVVGYPTTIDFDLTFQDGADECTIPLYLVAGKVSERTARDVLAGYISGAKAVKAAIEADTTLGAAAHSVRVTSMRILSVTVSQLDYLAALFDVEVIA